MESWSNRSTRYLVTLGLALAAALPGCGDETNGGAVPASPAAVAAAPPPDIPPGIETRVARGRKAAAARPPARHQP